MAAQTGASARELMQRMGHPALRAAMISQGHRGRSKHLAGPLDALVRERRGLER